MTLYLYAIVDARPPAERLGRGIARRPLSLVPAGGAFAVVEQAEAPAATPAAVVAHDRVVRRLARLVSAVLPFQFATTAPDRAAVRALFAPRARSLADALERVRGAAQFTLRVRGRAAPPPKAERRAGPGTQWLHARAAARRVPEIAPLTEATRPWVRDARAERHERPRRARAGEPPLVATVYHLVERRHARAWRAATLRALPELARGVHVTATGPWPPYAFAELA